MKLKTSVRLKSIFVPIPWMSSLNVRYLLRYLLNRGKALMLAKSSNWIRQFTPYLYITEKSVYRPISSEHRNTTKQKISSKPFVLSTKNPYKTIQILTVPFHVKWLVKCTSFSLQRGPSNCSLKDFHRWGGCGCSILKVFSFSVWA